MFLQQRTTCEVEVYAAHSPRNRTNSENYRNFLH